MNCVIGMCGDEPVKYGWCWRHFLMWLGTGDPLSDHEKRVLGMAGPSLGGIGPGGYRVLHCRGKYYYEHRYIWEQAHGPISAGYHVHHINGDKADNRLENLQLKNASDHISDHRTERQWGRVRMVPTCHSDRKHCAKGLCSECYYLERRVKKYRPAPPAPACHPDRTHKALGMCENCYSHHKYMRKRELSVASA